MAIDGTVGDAPSASTPTYCDRADVARVLQKPLPSAAADEGEPRPADWDDEILAAEEEVDRVTGSSWRPRRVRLEYHDRTTLVDEENWLLVQLQHAPVLELDDAQGDDLEVRSAGSYEEFLTGSKTAGPAGDYWLQEDQGLLRIRRSLWKLGSDSAEVRVSYRYGASDVPASIKQATALLAAAQLASGDVVMSGGHGGQASFMQVDPKVRLWLRRAAVLLAPFQRVGVGY